MSKGLSKGLQLRSYESPGLAGLIISVTAGYAVGPGQAGQAVGIVVVIAKLAVVPIRHRVRAIGPIIGVGDGFTIRIDQAGAVTNRVVAEADRLVGSIGESGQPV